MGMRKPVCDVREKMPEGMNGVGYKEKEVFPRSDCVFWKVLKEKKKRKRKDENVNNGFV